MTRRDRAAHARGPARAGAAPPPAPSPRRARRAWALVLVALAALTGAAALLRHPRTPGAASAPPAGAADTLTVERAYLEGARLYTAGRALESLPYFRRVGRLLRGPHREYEVQMAQALARAALEGRRDAQQPATRSSAERAALVREALEHLDAAERLSAAPHEVAELRAERANLYRVWGFPWEALIALRRAAAADPSWRLVAESGDLFAHRLHHPEQVIPGIDDDVSPPGAP